MRTAGAAIFTGIALGPILVLFPPSYFPWTFVLVALAGALVGIVGGGRTARRAIASSLVAALVLFIVAILVLGRPTSGSFSPVLFVVLWWLFVPMAAGSVIGTLARRELGALRALAAAGAGAAVLLLVGTALAEVSQEMGHTPAV